MIFGMLAFARSDITLGLDIVKNVIVRKFPESQVVNADKSNARHVDYLLVSLYWWRDIYAFVRFLFEAGVDPSKKKPVIIIGGMMTANPRPLTGYFHYAVLGDGEACIEDLIRCIEAGDDPYGITGVWNPNECEYAYSPTIPAELYTEITTKQFGDEVFKQPKTTRIEIARGCRGKCPFCQLAYTKPYREQPIEIVKQLVRTAPTKTVALFAPDRSSYSRIADAEQALISHHKANTGSDTRLDTLHRHESMSCVRFGVEGFSSQTRKKFCKVVSDKVLVDGLLYIINTLKTIQGGRHGNATMYMIGDLPGEGLDEIRHFWELIAEVDRQIDRRFTLFVSTSSFAPSPFTPMERVGINPYTQFNSWLDSGRYMRLKNIEPAIRGVVISAPQRLCQMLAIRGDESTARVVFWLATKAYKYVRSNKNSDGKVIERALQKAGFNPADLYRWLPDEYNLPWSNIKPPVRVGRPWRKDDGSKKESN